jgi:hypothetical protein
LILLSAVFFLAALPGCSRRATSVQVDPALAALAPPDARALAGIDLRALRSTPVFSKWIAPRLEKLGKEGNTDLAAQGIQVLAVTDGKTVSMFARTPSGVRRLNSNEPLPPRSGGIPPRLLQQLRSIPADNQIWSCGAGEMGLLREVLPGGENAQAVLHQIAQGMESYTVGMDLRQGLRLEARARYASAADLKRVRDGLQGLLKLVQISVPKNRPGLLRLFEGIRIQDDPGQLLITATLKPEELDSVFSSLPGR